MGRVMLLLLTLAASIVTSLVALEGDKARIEGGWTEVSSKWPLEQREYFISTFRGHNFIELELPEEPQEDLKIRLQYFYAYERVRPVIQVVACRIQQDIVRADWTVVPDQREWVYFEYTVNQGACKDRRQIVFNVLLHDAGDVFAWKFMEIRGHLEHPYTFTTTIEPPTTTTEIEAETTTTTTATTTPSSTTIEPMTTTVKYLEPSTTRPESSARFKRFSGFQRLVCQPSSCDRNMFKHKHFRPLIRGLPQVTAQQLQEGKRFFISQNMEKLEFVLESSSDLSEVDTCLDLQLYMDADTELEFRLDDGTQHERLLELVKRQTNDSTAAKWDTFKRCLSDYMPRLKTSEGPIRLVFGPKPLAAGKLVGLLVDVQKTNTERKLHPIHEYLPDIKSLDSETDVDKYWVFDRDGIKKPALSFESNSEDASTKRLRVSQIEHQQESFDLTSRWLQVPSELLAGDNKQLLFNYQVERAGWIKAIEFEYQNGCQKEAPKWIRQVVYTDSSSNSATSPQASSTGPTPEPSSYAKDQREVVTTTTSLLHHLDHDTSETIPLSIRLLNLGSDEFRMRIRHLLKPGAPVERSLGHQLVIRTLAFGDVCATGNYCQNGGKCKSLGAAKAECTCLAGYSGQHCEKVRPCEVMFGDQTGKELCESVGAQCVVHLPVYRCQWPNDEHFISQVLYRVDAEGNPIEPFKVGLTSEELKEKVDKQSRLIIVLSVFMVAMLLFAVVIVANMVSRLIKSKRNLKTVQMEVVELSRRSSEFPSTSMGAFGGRSHSAATSVAANRVNRPTSGVSYSNQSFDAD